jgi:tRNA-2-methylthio-N6-dimethylallyladenosine synthase
MNKADSAGLAAGLEELGYTPARVLDEADIVVVNSCVVRQSAENRVISKLESLAQVKRARPELTVALVGCMVGAQTVELRRRFPHVDLCLKPGEFAPLVELASERAPGCGDRRQATALPPSAFVTIIEGCDNFCTYCVVPHRRGRERSREVRDICTEVEGFVERGVREVTLLGQNVNSYGHDLPGQPELADLLQVLDSVRGLERIRFLTSHPKDMSEKLMRAVRSLEKVCELISLPVQAGDDDILRAMGRGYTAEFYRKLVEQIRREIPGVALSTDVIVGFPGETGEQYQRTLDLLSELRFDTVHCAAYSPRPGTAASEGLEDDVPLFEKKKRLQVVEDLQRGIAGEINSRLLARAMEVLVEGEKQGKWQGRTRTGKLVFFEHDDDCLGQLVDVEIRWTGPWSLQGRVETAGRESNVGVGIRA